MQSHVQTCLRHCNQLAGTGQSQLLEEPSATHLDTPLVLSTLQIGQDASSNLPDHLPMSRHELTDEKLGHFPLSAKLTKQSNSVPKLAVSSSTELVRSNSFDSLSWRTSDQRYLVLKSHLLLPPAAANRKHRLLILLQLPLIWPLQCPDADGHTFVAGTSQQVSPTMRLQCIQFACNTCLTQ